MSASSEPAAASTAVVIPVDLHARPAGLLVRAASRFAAAVWVAVAGRSANARSVLEVMSLGATAGSEVVVRAEGADAADAVQTLGALLSTVE